MKIASLIARFLLAFVFIGGGIFGVVATANPTLVPPGPPGLASAFQDVYFRSHYVLFVDSIGLVAGIALALDRYAALGLVTLAAVIANIWIFHLSMAPQTIAGAIVVTVVWVFAALPYRAHFAPLLAAKR